MLSENRIAMFDCDSILVLNINDRLYFLVQPYFRTGSAWTKYYLCGHEWKRLREQSSCLSALDFRHEPKAHRMVQRVFVRIFGGHLCKYFSDACRQFKR